MRVPSAAADVCLYGAQLAQGIDAVAAGELAELERRGCLARNSVLIHGVGLSETDIACVIACGAAVVWCPSSNLTLLGRTLTPQRLCAAGLLALGSDSRLSGGCDLLDDLRLAAAHGLDATQAVDLATVAAADILRLPGRGCLTPGAHADLVIVAACRRRVWSAWRVVHCVRSCAMDVRKSPTPISPTGLPPLA